MNISSNISTMYGQYSSNIVTRNESEISISDSTLDIDCDGCNEFVSTNRLSVSSSIQVTLTNLTNARFITFKVLISNLATITFPSGSISGDNRFSSLVWTPTENGNYTFSIYVTSTEYEIVASLNPAL